MIVQFRDEKVSNHGSIPIPIDCNVVAFIVFEEGFHQPIKRPKQSVFLDVTVFRHTLWISFTPNAAVLFVDVAIQPEVRFIAKQNSLMKIGNNGNLVLGPFDESTPCWMIVLMNCQTKLRINHLIAVKSVAILENGDRFNSCQVIYSQFGLAIHQNDHQARRRFVEWAQNEIAVVPDFHKRILFSDEAHFWLNGYVNKQNGRIWSEANPQVYVETPLHPEKLTVWCALWASGIIGPYFFKNDEAHNELWFQQDGATCHTARATIDLLKDTFGDRLISRFGPVNWPPRSCDLTPLDYFLWGYVKSLVYADKPQTLDHLEDNIRRVIVDIRPQMLEKVVENWTSRLDYIRVSRGSPMPEVIFKM
ncbi:DUF4817 domain-containing protein [Trichonephila clavipes]|nr:DUF4817 domain-containing protein [Trichonephila clavipes]